MISHRYLSRFKAFDPGSTSCLLNKLTPVQIIEFAQLFEFPHNIQQSTLDAMSSAIVVSTCD